MAKGGEKPPALGFLNIYYYTSPSGCHKARGSQHGREKTIPGQPKDWEKESHSRWPRGQSPKCTGKHSENYFTLKTICKQHENDLHSIHILLGIKSKTDMI